MENNFLHYHHAAVFIFIHCSIFDVYIWTLRNQNQKQERIEIYYLHGMCIMRKMVESLVGLEK